MDISEDLRKAYTFSKSALVVDCYYLLQSNRIVLGSPLTIMELFLLELICFAQGVFLLRMCPLAIHV